MNSRKKKKAKQDSDDSNGNSTKLPPVSTNPDTTKRVKVTQLAAAAVAETAKKRALTFEEEQTLKTRLQYRLYQRNHRAKRLQRQQSLEVEINTLHTSIESLVDKLQTTWLEVARTVLDDHLAFFCQCDPDQRVHHETRLCASVGASCGAHVFDQWRQFCAAFTDWRIAWQRESIRVMQQYGDTIVVSIDVALHLHGTREQFDAVMPGLAESDQVGPALERDGLVVEGRGVYGITTMRVVEWYTLELDGLAALRRVGVRQIDRIARILTESHVSLSLGTITSTRETSHTSITPEATRKDHDHEDDEQDDPQRDGSSDSRLSLRYLLS